MNKLFLLFGIISCCYCNENNISPGPTDPSADTPIHKDPQLTVMRDTSIYRIRLSDTVVLALQQWDSTIDLQRYLGKPLTQKSTQLDRNSDTFSGSFVKDLEYDGLKLKLFSPSSNGKTFWLQEIILSNEKYKTTRGIGIGDEWQKVKESYPSLKMLAGGNGNIYHVTDESYEKTIEMEFQNNKVKSLRMNYAMN